MLELDVCLGEVAGAMSNGSDSERWFIDIEHERVFMISTNMHTDEQIEQLVDMITANQENYIPLPYITHDEFLTEVDHYTRILADSPSLARLLEKAVEDKCSKGQIMQLLNRDPGRNKEFGEFYAERIQEKVLAWLASQNIKLKK